MLDRRNTGREGSLIREHIMSTSFSSPPALYSTLLHWHDIGFGEDKFGNRVVTSEFCNLSMRDSSAQICSCEQSVEECAGERTCFMLDALQISNLRAI